MRDWTVLVTGAGSGLGAAIARRLAADGAWVVVNDVDGAAAGAVAASVGGEAAVFDVADAAQVDAAVDAVVARRGRLDVVVNNAGIAPHRPEVTDRSMAALAARMSGEAPAPVRACSTLSDAAWDRMVRVHLYGTFHCTRAALRHMEDADAVPSGPSGAPRRGAIVNIASIAGIQGLAGAADYSAAKGGIIAFTKAVASEVAPIGIRVNAVAPSFIDTPLLDPMSAETREMLVLRSGSGRLGHPDEVAEAVRYLAGEGSGYCFGEVLSLSGALA